MFDAEDFIRGPGLVLHDLELNRTADHHVRQLLLVGLAGVNCADVLALAQDGDAVGDLHDLIELVGDEEDAFALLGKLAHGGHKLVYLLRSEDGGRLVKDKYLIIAVEHLEDLNTLLHTDGDILDLCVEVDVQTVFLAQRLNLGARFLLLDEAELRRLRAEDDVIKDREHLDQLEMLVHHTDLERGRVVGVVYLDFHAVLAYLARLRLVQAEENAHKSGLARAVFAEQSVDLTLFEL